MSAKAIKELSERIEQLDIPAIDNITVLATGPLTSEKLANKIRNFTGIITST